VLYSLSQIVFIQFLLVPGHVGIIGNETAYWLAKLSVVSCHPSAVAIP